jgi:hypothetical protein
LLLSRCGLAGEERQKEAITAAVQQLQLSTQQVLQISQATAVFKRLLAPLIQGRQKLQGTGFTAASSASAAVQAPGVKLEGGGVSSAAVLPQQAAVLQRLQQQQRKVASLSTLMKKVWHSVMRTRGVLPQGRDTFALFQTCTTWPCWLKVGTIELEAWR